MWMAGGELFLHAMTTIYDIAKATSVSPATVSRVINGRPGVNDATVTKIKIAMEKLNFRPRWKAFDRKRLLLLVPEHPRALCSTYLSHIVAGVCDSSFALGYTLVVRPFLDKVKNGREIRQMVMQEGVSGCLILSLPRGYGLADRIGMEKIPHVVIGYKTRDDSMNQILLNDYQAGKDATEYLLSLGHRKIAMISFSHDDHGHAQRACGYVDTLKKANLKQRPICLEYKDATQSAGAEGARRLFSQPDRPTAVIVTNEQLTLGFQNEVKQMGFSIPQDVSVIGFEEDAILENLDTPLTAIRIPAYEMGVESVKMILKEIENDDDEPSIANSQNLSPVLVARRSTRALNA